MRLPEIKSLREMAGPAQTCPKCGQSPIHTTHYRVKDANGVPYWKCKTKPSASASSPIPLSPSASPAPMKPSTPSSPSAVTSFRTPVPSAPTDKKDLIKGWLDRQKIENYIVREDYTIDVDGDVNLHEMKHRILPVKFGKVTGDFHMYGIGILTSPKGCPDEVGGDLWLQHNSLDTLEGMSKKVEGNVFISQNPIKSIDGLTSYIGQSLYAETMPELTSLHNIHKYLKHIGDEINFTDCKITSSIAGVLLIEGLKKVVNIGNQQITDIINKHLTSENYDPHTCAEDLGQAGFEDFLEL